MKDFSLAAIEQALDWPEGYANEVLESEGHQPPSDASHHVIEGDVVDWIKQSDVLTSFQKEQLLNIVDALQEGRVATREGDEAAARRAAERLAATAPAAAADARRRDESGTSEQASQRRRRA